VEEAYQCLLFFMDYKTKLLEAVPKMNGWCDPAKANHIFDSVIKQRATRCVELGVFAGRSLIAFGLALAKLGNPKSVVYGVDTWSAIAATTNNDGDNAQWWKSVDYDAIRHECVSTCESLEISTYVKLMKMSTVQAFYEIDGNVDILHIDGNHSQWDSTRDVTMWVDRVVAKGIIYFGDEDWVSTKTAQRLLELKCIKIDEIKTTNVCGVYRKLG
jgi:hypothetical protein